MTDVNDWERRYYRDRDNHQINYDPETMQPPVVYGEEPFKDNELLPDNAIYDHGTDPERHDGIPTHYSHGLYEPYPYTQPSYPPKAELNAACVHGEGLAPEKGRFHIRYFGTVEHSMSMPHDPTSVTHKKGGLISMSIRDDNDNHLHTDVHTFNPLSLLNELNCPQGTRVRVDIQDWDNVIKDFIYNFPTQLCPWQIDWDSEKKQASTYVSLGQYDGNKKMALADFMDLIGSYFRLNDQNLMDLLKQYVKDHNWIVDVPKQVGMDLLPQDGVCLPYCHMPYPAIHGDFTYNPATHLGSLSFNYVCHIIKPNRDDPRVYEMRNPFLFHSGTIPKTICPKDPMRLTCYATVMVRSGCSEIVEQDTDNLDLVIEPDGSVRVDGSLWLQHHEVGKPRVHENDRWRIEIASHGGMILF